MAKTTQVEIEPEAQKTEQDQTAGAPDGRSGDDLHTVAGVENEPEGGQTAPAAAAEPNLEERLKAAEENARCAHDQYLRASADLENLKKRTVREMEGFRKFANETLLRELLTVVDNLERALESANGENGAEKSVVEGVDLTLRELIRIFEKFKVKQIDALGKPFDPNFHQAVLRQPSADAPENTVLQEFQKGYMIHDRLLRPAMVVVSTASTASEIDRKASESKSG